ncbi:hypothetical protein [Tumebacillus permanentifrigoris]|uniref:Uncharacterized protein n=1 Tax=Tumebacillus permanentifrigoris TaxID=378543 RepID=A0A316DEE9_9BACL|nr:hypothetical protein [Tumebacillus permanentifrigoris]PWK16018.1 hypothetical protein C7459_102264 [Tumebacillus permanentifrigoris]
MSESNTTHYIKQVWRQKGDVLFDHIPFKEANKANDLSQTTRPVLVLETKSNGGSGTVFAIGRVTNASVVEKAIEYPNGEFLYHVPFAYDLILEDKKNGITREELQELTGQKFTPQAKGGLFEISADHYGQLVELLHARNTVAAVAATAEAVAPKVEVAPKPKAAPQVEATPPASPAPKASGSLADALLAAKDKLASEPHLRLVIEDGKLSYYPAALLAETDLTTLQENITNTISTDSTASVEATEAAATSSYANLIGLVERLLREGKYDSVQTPTLAKAFYRGTTNLPHPYLAIELQGTLGHHVLGLNGTLYTVDGKRVQHFLGL